MNRKIEFSIKNIVIVGFSIITISVIGSYLSTSYALTENGYAVDSNNVEYKDSTNNMITSVQAAINGTCSKVGSLQTQIDSMNNNILLKNVTFSTVSSLNTSYDTSITLNLDTISGYTPVFLINVRTNSAGVAIEYFGVNNNQAYLRMIRAGGSTTQSFAPQATVVYFKDTMNYS